MPITVVVGSQWGDEGKGRVTDMLAAEADLVARYSGGDNAGHTVMGGTRFLSYTSFHPASSSPMRW